MSLWEAEIEAEHKKRKKEVKHILNPAYSWNLKMKKGKKKKEKAYYRKIRETQAYAKTENSSFPKDVWNEEDSLGAVFHKNKMEASSANKKTSSAGVPPLCECARKLKENVKIICIENRLYCFNGICYQALDKTGLVQLYRDNVNRDLHGARNVKGFYELYNYLLTDSEIKLKPNRDKLSNLAVLKNGIYNLKKAKFELHDPSVIAFSYVNARYTENEECPTFENFIREVTGNQEILIERMWRFLGYIFTQSLDAKAFFVMGCAPNSGKSLLGKFIMKLYEPQYVSSIALSDFNGDFSLGTLVGAAVNISLDLPGSRLSASATSRLKMLTGGDLIIINEKYVPQFKYQNRAKFIFASNHPIQLAEDDNAFWERLVFLPFNHSIDKSNQDTDMLKKLLKEKDAVVSKALQYARILMQENYVFPTTEEIERQVRKWRGIEIDTISNFIAEKCRIGSAYDGVTMSDLYAAYEGYCMEIGELPENKATMKGYLQNKVGLKHKKSRLGKGGNPKSAFCGITLVEKMCEKQYQEVEAW